MRLPARFNRIAIVGGVTVSMGVLGTTTALALWSTGGTAVATASAGQVPASPAPHAKADGQNVTVTLPDGVKKSELQVRGYRVTRYNAANTRVDAGGGCGGVVTDASCVETGVPAGTWRYSVRPIVGSSWTGPESKPSNPVTVAQGPGQNLASTEVPAGNAPQPTQPPAESTTTGQPSPAGPAKAPTGTAEAPTTQPTTQPTDPAPAGSDKPAQDPPSTQDPPPAGP